MKCIIFTKSCYRKSLSRFFRRKGYQVIVVRTSKEKLQQILSQKNFNGVVLVDESSVKNHVFGLIKEINPEIDVFVLADRTKTFKFREAAKKGIELITGPKPPPANYLWSIIERKKRRKIDPAFQKLPRDNLLKIIARAVSPGAEKFVFELEDGQLIEAVALNLCYRPIPFVICVSVQVGCAIGCRFCATGSVKFHRNLTAKEIVGQVRKVLGKSVFGQEILNQQKPFQVTFMGEGEPMLNFNEVAKAIKTLRKIFGERISFTISTVGIGLRKLLKEKFGPWVTLQISLHTPDEAQRRKLIPVSNNLTEVIALAQRYAEKNKRKVCVNYILMRGQNDSRQHAEKLANLLNSPDYFYIKLSQLNPIPIKKSLLPASRMKRRIFRNILESYGYEVKYFISRGRDIGSGCGQMVGGT